ncbi:Matrilin-4 [Entomophthora muscae]|nr:Matrilin-4 [Entomophthora muscae]
MIPRLPSCYRYKDNQIPAHLKTLPEKCFQRPLYMPCLFSMDEYEFNPSTGRCDTIRVGYCGGCKVFSSLAHCQKLCEPLSI